MFNSQLLSREDAEEAKGFLATPPSVQESYDGEPRIIPRHKLISWMRAPSILLHRLLILLCTLIFVHISVTARPIDRHGPRLVYSQIIPSKSAASDLLMMYIAPA